MGGRATHWPPSHRPSMSEPCDICAADAMRPCLDVQLVGTRPASVHRCGRCGFRQIRPRLADDEIKALYPSDYFDSASAIGYADYARESYRRQREAYFLTGWLRGLRPDGRLLEVGCALGFLLAGLRGSGWQLQGVDASAFAAFYARTRYDLDVTCATLEEAAFPDESFDVVIQKDLLEHVADPRRHLLETYRILRPGGWLRLVTPNGEANLRPLLAASRAPGSAPPVLDQGHLSFFGRGHLTRLFDECGFRCRRMRAVGIKRGLRALGWLPGQQRFVRGRDSVASTPEDLTHAETGGTAERFEVLAGRIDAQIASSGGGFRRSTAYRHWHRAMKRLDAWPAWCDVGYDYDCLLQRD